MRGEHKRECPGSIESLVTVTKLEVQPLTPHSRSHSFVSVGYHRKLPQTITQCSLWSLFLVHFVKTTVNWVSVICSQNNFDYTGTRKYGYG